MESVILRRDAGGEKDCRRAQSLFLPIDRQYLPSRTLSRHKSIREGWGRLSFVWPNRDNTVTEGRICDAPFERIDDDSTQPPAPKDEPELTACCGGTPSADAEDTTGLAAPPVARSDNAMSGSSGGTPATYNTFRKGIKATTSKLMSAASVKGQRIPPAPPPPFERTGSERGDAGRFLEGVSFKGKLIGVLEVTEARGDRMCQEALAELKTAVRAAGEHKQKITVTVAMDGIRLRDERTADCLYHHPVHKISFIAQDMTDTRAFGYICGSPDAGHKFFGIKTEKTASLVVIAMRDLFQVVFEMKKKEIEKAKAQLKEGKDVSDFKDDPGGDPFGDTFRPDAAAADGATASLDAAKPFTLAAPTALAPPPASVRSRHDHSRGGPSAAPPSDKKPPSEFAKFPVDFKNLNQGAISRDTSERYLALRASQSSSHSGGGQSQPQYDNCAATDYGGNEVFDAQWSMAKSNACDDADEPVFGLFTDLDPLGTGKTKPFVDRKDFFHEIRSATSRKVLRDMNDPVDSPCSGSLRGAAAPQPGTIPAEVSALVASATVYSTAGGSRPVRGARGRDSFSSGHNASFGDECRSARSVSRERLDGGSVVGFADFNPFTDSPRSQRSDFSSGGGVTFDEAVAACGSLTGGERLAVALPPLSFRDSPPSFSPPPPPRSPSRSMSDYSPQPAMMHDRMPPSRAAVSSPLSPKTLPRSHKFARQLSCDEWASPERRATPTNGLSFGATPFGATAGGISPRPRPRSSLCKVNASTLPFKTRRAARCSATSLATSSPKFEREYFRPAAAVVKTPFEAAPVPPPRPAPVQPPPLPPKRLPSHITFKPPPRPPITSDPHYSYINEYDSSPDHQPTLSPPIPIPARRPKHSEGLPSAAATRGGRSQNDVSASFSFSAAPCNISPVRDTLSRSDRASVSSKCSTPGRSHSRMSQLDLANTSLDQLACNLNISVEKLAKMTVVELAACLAQQQVTPREALEEDRSSRQSYFEEQLQSGFRDSDQQSDWSRDKFTFDDDHAFAKFQTDFPKSPVDTPNLNGTPDPDKGGPLAAPVSEDRYAVFKELSMANKQKSVFDENFLTPQNSVEDEVSEVSSGTFKVNFHNEDLYPESIDRKSSISDEVELTEINRDRIDHECVTVFRSPDISEYENFEPNFECKFEDDFSAASVSERSLTPVNSPAQFAGSFNNRVATGDTFPEGHPRRDLMLEKQSSFLRSSGSLGKSPDIRCRTGSDSRMTPFDDNFSEFNVARNNYHEAEPQRNDNTRRSRRSELTKEKKARKKSSLEARKSSDKSISPFDDDFTQRTDKYEVLRDLENEKDASFEGEVFAPSHQDMLSPFEDSWHRSRSEDQKSLASKNSAEEEARQSPFDRISTGSRKLSDDQDRHSRLSSEQRSSLSEPMTSLRPRDASRISIGSEDSCDVRSSPFEDNFREKPQQQRNEEAPAFADFENAFQPTPDEGGPAVKENAEQEIFPDVETEFKVSVKYSRPGGHSEGIEGRGFFRRDSDPFADEFFAEDDQLARQQPAEGQFWRDDFNNFKFGKDV